MVAAMLTEAPVPPAQLTELPAELGRIVMRCLEREPHDRFASIGALAAALDGVLATCEPVHEAVTTVGAASHPGAADEERTWIDPGARPVPALDDDRKDTVRDRRPLPLRPSRTSARTAPVEAQLRRAPSGTPAPQVTPHPTPPRGIGLASYPGAPTTPLYTTLPGIAVVASPGASLTPPRGMPVGVRGSAPRLRDSAPALPARALPTSYPVVPREWRTPADAPSPYLPAPCAAPPPASSTTWKAIWLALVVACVTTLVLAVALGAIP
jgi:hypothetical protein